MKLAIKTAIRDTKLEPPIRWAVKRLRGLQMPYDLVKNEIYDRQAVDLIRQVLSASSNCIDVGAHRGQFLREFLRCSPHGNHLAFEPIPHLAAELRTTFKAVQVFNLALTDRSGSTSFFVFPESPALSGLSERRFIRPDAARQEIRVKTERLDALLPPDQRIDLIKIDVEGAEGLVIAGAIETIRRSTPYVIFEHGQQSSQVFGTTSTDLYDRLTGECGLRISLLADWLRRRRPLTRSEFARADAWYFVAHPARPARGQ
jgi:FkbM family methyltransferase